MSCSHSVYVLWDCATDGTTRAHYLDGFNWRLAFCPVRKGKDAAIEAARQAGLPIAGD